MILYGVGVGVGDPLDMTLKAVKTIESCEVIAVPLSAKGRSMMAYDIAKQVVDLSKKTILELDMPMVRDVNILAQHHKKAAEQVVQVLKQGKDVAFLTIGDPTVYSTYIYVHKLVVEMGYKAKIISGITSFTAAAARLGISLSEKEEMISVIPSSYETLQELPKQGTKVLMKTGKHMQKVKEKLRQEGIYEKAMMVERCGLEGEVIHKSMDTVTDEASYFSLIIIKE